MPFDIDTYFQKEVDDRDIHGAYNFELISDLLPKVDIFTGEEMETLNAAQQKFLKNVSELTENEYRKEMERLGVDLSWKSSQIEGNTYTLLETERLLKEKITASGKTQEDAMRSACELINGKENRFEKALLAILLLSYIQPFSDGNKRTARITGNALLIAGGYCPMSFRSVDSIDYKKAMLIFYEQNNISAFKKIFIDQYIFAVESYF